MNLNEYQSRAIATRQPNPQIVAYLTLGLAAEAGEVADKFAKAIRDDLWNIESVASGPDSDAVGDHDRFKRDVAKELGDVLWFVASLADTLGIPLDRVALMNLEKLASRAERGKLNGSGDNR